MRATMAAMTVTKNIVKKWMNEVSRWVRGEGDGRGEKRNWDITVAATASSTRDFSTHSSPYSSTTLTSSPLKKPLISATIGGILRCVLVFTDDRWGTLNERSISEPVRTALNLIEVPVAILRLAGAIYPAGAWAKSPMPFFLLESSTSRGSYGAASPPRHGVPSESSITIVRHAT
jgi:hypothetical protein